MPAIALNGSAPKVVVVNRRSNVATVTARASAVQVPSRDPDVATVAERSRTIGVASTGVQGRPGLNGDAIGDNLTFNDNLALLYSVAKS
ncbi:MAG: hypothetical protein ACREO4_06240 [Lysobacter sp.]